MQADLGPRLVNQEICLHPVPEKDSPRQDCWFVLKAAPEWLTASVDFCGSYALLLPLRRTSCQGSVCSDRGSMSFHRVTSCGLHHQPSRGRGSLCLCCIIGIAIVSELRIYLLLASNYLVEAISQWSAVACACVDP